MSSDHHSESSQRGGPGVGGRGGNSALLRRQPEIEEVEEEDTSPGSDQSDTTITAGTDVPHVTESGSPGSGSPDDLKPISPTSHKLNHISPKLKQLTRSEALCDECASPPLDPLQSTASTCSTDSSSSGIGSKSLTSGSVSGSSSRGRLEKDGSQSSEAGTSSSLSRDSSVDTPYKDSTGIDLEDFIKKTLNKTPKDRSMLIKLEVDLIKFIREPKHHYLKFPQMSSYDRMLVHRIAAFFGLDHNVDQTGKCVIVNKTQNTRIPDFTFQDHIMNNGGESKPKMLLKRGGGSFDELKTRSLQKPSLDATRAKSLEERQQMYDEARNRIFTSEEQAECQAAGYCSEDAVVTGIVKKMGRPQSLGGAGGSSKDEMPTWSSSESSGYGTDGSGKARILFPKANSFGGTQTFVLSHLKSPMRGSSLSKADSMSMGVGALQPNIGSPLVRPMLMSSPTCSQSDASSMSGSSSSGLAPSPQHMAGNLAGSLPGPGGQQKLYWVASDLSSIPAGSVLINPQTGQPFANADGTTYRYIPGQPLPGPGPGATTFQPQQATMAIQQQQPQMYQMAQPPTDWSQQISQDSQSSSDMCQQLSVMKITPQSSLDSGVGAGDGAPLVPQQPIVFTGQPAALQQQQPGQLAATQQPQPVQQQQPQAFIQQSAVPTVNQSQGVFYPGTGSLPGQQAVRYMCPVNYATPTSVAQPGGQHTGYLTGAQQVPIDTGSAGNQAATQQGYPAQHQQYCPQYVQNYAVAGGSNGQQVYPLTSQAGQMLSQQPAQHNCEVGSYQCGYSVTSPMESQGLIISSTGYNYGVTYNQPAAAATPTAQSQMYYAVQAPQSNQPQIQGFSAYTGSHQGSTYQTSTPPSQVSSVNPNVQLNTLTGQPVNVNNLSNVNTVTIPGQPGGGVMAGDTGAPTSSAPNANNSQLISYPSSHPTLAHATQQYPQSFTANPLRPVTPQVVPLPSLAMHGQSPGAAAQTFHSVYRPNMQMPNMQQLHQQSQQQQQQQPAVVTSKSPQQQGNSQPPHTHVTVSAKSVSYESVPNGGGKVENGSGEGTDVSTATEGHMGPSSNIRPQIPSTAGELRLQYQHQPQYRPQVQPVQFTQQQQQQQQQHAQPINKSSPTAPKPQRVKKARSKDSQQSRLASQSDSSLAMSNILEVCDLPHHMRRSEVDRLLQALVTAGANLQFVSAELDSHSTTTNNQADYNTSNNQTISQHARVFAVFPDSPTASQMYASHADTAYRLVPVESSSLAGSQA